MKLFEIFNSKQIRVAAMGSLTIKFLSAFLAFLNGVILARILEIEAFGVYVLAFTTVTIISMVVSLGFPELITRYVSKYAVTNNNEAIKGLLIKTNTYVLWAILISGILIVLAYLLWWNRFDESTVHTFWYGFLLVPLLVFGSLRAAALRGLKYIILAEMPETLIRNLLFCLALLGWILIGEVYTPEMAMLLHVGAAAVAFVLGYVFLKSKLLNRLRTIKATYHSKEWVRQAVPFSITQLTTTLKTKLITYVLVFFGSLEAVALFDVAMRGATLVSFTLSALNSAISPYISSAFTHKNIETVQRIVTKSNRIVFVFALPVALAFIFGGETLIGWVFGEEYVLAYVPLVVVCVAQLVNAITGASGPVLNMTGNQSFLSKNQVYMMLITLVLSIPLVIQYDVLGAAILFSAVLVIQNIILVLFIKKKLNVNMTIF